VTVRQLPVWCRRPINFHDIERYQQRTLYGLHSTITQGVNGTTMNAFAQLSDGDRWSLAFYVGNMAVAAKDIDPDALKASDNTLLNISKLTITTPAQAEELYGETGTEAMAYLRHHPEMFYNSESNLAFARQRLADVIVAYKNNEPKKAYQYAVEAYLEGFELVEQNINAFDKSLRLEIEIAMTGLRNQIRNGESIEIIEEDIAFINEKLAIAQEMLDSTSLSGGAAFASVLFYSIA